MSTETVSLDDMFATGITRRQVNYWSDRGYLRPPTAHPGKGCPREWPAVERDVARLMVRLITAGLEVERAASVARVAIEHGHQAVALADGITITLQAA